MLVGASCQLFNYNQAGLNLFELDSLYRRDPAYQR
jgi:hypothetical protein